MAAEFPAVEVSPPLEILTEMEGVIQATEKMVVNHSFLCNRITDHSQRADIEFLKQRDALPHANRL